MFNKKSMKILTVILLAVVVLMMVGGTVFAGVAENFNDLSVEAPTGGDQIAKMILGTLKWAGIIISIGMLIFLGIKYVTSSPDGKANLKGQLGIYVLGLVCIVGATCIVGALESTIEGATGTKTTEIPNGGCVYIKTIDETKLI